MTDHTPWWAQKVTVSPEALRQQYTRPVASVKEAEATGSAFAGLISRQTEKAIKAMKEDLEQQLFYGSTFKVMKQEYPPFEEKFVGVSTFDKVISDQYMDKIRDNVFSESMIMKCLKDNKEKAEMSTTVEIVRKAVEQKKKEKAENLVEYLTSFFDQGEFTDGDTIGWNATFPNNDKVYRYAAIKSGGRWYITNRHGDFDDMGMVELISALAIDGTVVMDGDNEPL